LSTQRGAVQVLQIGDLFMRSTFSFPLKSEADVYFKWRYNPQYNCKDTYYFKVPNYIQVNCNKTNSLESKHYNLPSGEVIWRVINPDGGHGYLDDLFINYYKILCEQNIFIKFKDENYVPAEGISSLEPNAAINRGCFSYNISLDTNFTTCDVSLFTISPGCDKSSSTYQGKRLYMGQERLEWDKINLNCSICGQSYYYFNATNDGRNFIESKIYKGPFIYACILKTDKIGQKIINGTHFEDQYLIRLSGTRKFDVYLSTKNKSGYWNDFDGFQPYDNNGEQEQTWSILWNRKEIDNGTVKGVEFRIRDKNGE